MKRSLLLIAFVFSIKQLTAQKHARQYYDSVLTKTLQRFVGHPDCDACDSAGIVLLKIYKIKDSIHIDILFTSDKIYNAGILQAAKWINKRNKTLFKNKYRALVPLYFRFEKADKEAPQVSANQKIILQQQIKKYGRRTHAVAPITIIGYAPVRKQTSGT